MASWTAPATVGFIALFFALGAIWPRVQPGIDWKDTWINLVTGGFLFAIRLGLKFAFAVPLAALGAAWVDLSAVTNPWLQGVLVFFALDIVRYWVHYADHRVPFLWQFHAVHHSSETLNATSGLRMHAFDILQLTLIPTLLFGVLLDISSFHALALPVVLTIGAFFDAFEHSNLPWDVRRPLLGAWDKLLNNPHFHSWHHTRDGSTIDGNYGQTLTVWDRLFGTCVSEALPPELLGLEAKKALVNEVVSLQLLKKRGV
ncbi:MAG: sterol desaturase family protein [Alphaproteobacteria bacterium]|nr:sterol desaturase family protein [Alphaproteobacteria bacterium]MCB9791436.1 sterol desaturase family protein [Alphaproteobacteria bacterium]